MSKENLEQFIQQISDSEELQSTIGDEIDTDAFIALGAEHGCEFTEEDVMQNVGLSDDELDSVAGGVLIQTGVTADKGGISITRFREGNRLGFAVAERNSMNG